MKKSASPIPLPATPAPYQAPRIESVLRASDLERELLYAGVVVVSSVSSA